jgi:hypothetical protein
MVIVRSFTTDLLKPLNERHTATAETSMLESIQWVGTAYTLRAGEGAFFGIWFKPRESGVER